MRVAAGAAVWAFTACSDASLLPTEPVAPAESPGAAVQWIDVKLTTPNDNDGAVLLEISGGRVLSANGLDLSVDARIADSGPAIVIASGNIRSGQLLKIKVPATASASSYSGRVLQAARRDTFEQQSVSAYKLDFAPAP
jgi:hypothetical protein